MWVNYYWQYIIEEEEEESKAKRSKAKQSKAKMSNNNKKKNITNIWPITILWYGEARTTDQRNKNLLERAYTRANVCYFICQLNYRNQNIIGWYIIGHTTICEGSIKIFFFFCFYLFSFIFIYFYFNFFIFILIFILYSFIFIVLLFFLQLARI